MKTKIIPDEYDLYTFDKLYKNKKEVLNKRDAYQRIRESYRRIKHEFRNDANNIEALRFHSYEMQIYKMELAIGKENTKKYRLIIFLRNILKEFAKRFSIKSNRGERIILWFNDKSNNFGTSWTRGVIFTLIVAVVFYIIFLLSISYRLNFDPTWIGFSKAFVHLIQFLNIVEWDFEPFGIKNLKGAYIILFIGRIFISYGYYQTIQAFRKYGKS